MNFKYFFLISFILMLTGCSTDDDVIRDPEFETRLIKSTEGRNGMILQYQNDLPVKILLHGIGEQDFFPVAMEIEYNENFRVSRILMDTQGNYSLEDGFDFELNPESWEIMVFNYHYENERLERITNVSGTTIHAVKYDSHGRVVEENRSGSYIPGSNTWVKSEYSYGSTGFMNYYKTERGEEIKEGEIVVDEKANPLYILWRDFSLVLPRFYIHNWNDNNIPYQPYNILEKYINGELDYKASFEYDGDYPSHYFLEILSGTYMSEQTSPSLDLNIIYN